MEHIFQNRQSVESAEELTSKVSSLERDLYYYKKTSRDLRKKLQGTRVGGEGTVMETLKRDEEERVNSAPELDGSGRSQQRKVKRKRSSKDGNAASGTRNGNGFELAGKGSGNEKGIMATGSIHAQKEFEAGTDAKVLVDSDVMVGPGGVSQAANQKKLQQQVVKKHRSELRQLRSVVIEELFPHCFWLFLWPGLVNF